MESGTEMVGGAGVVVGQGSTDVVQWWSDRRMIMGEK
jgi:hypothetical protein